MILLYLAVVALVGLVTYYFAVQSRRTFTCPSCGEKIKTEYLKAERCSTCGASLGEGIKDD